MAKEKNSNRSRRIEEEKWYDAKRADKGSTDW